MNIFELKKKQWFSGVVTAAALILSGSATAFSNFSPLVEEGEVGVELRYANVVAGEELEKGNQFIEVAVEWHFSEQWRLELTVDNEKLKGMELETEAVELEFIRNLTEQKGNDGFSSAVVVGYGLAQEETAADTVELGVYVMRGYGVAKGEGDDEEGAYESSILVNLMLERGVGSNAEGGTEFAYGAQYKQSMGEFEVGVEAFGEVSDDTKEHYMGPVLFGELELGEKSELGYQLGYMLGLSDDASDGVLKLNLGFEF